MIDQGVKLNNGWAVQVPAEPITFCADSKRKEGDED